MTSRALSGPNPDRLGTAFAARSVQPQGSGPVQLLVGMAQFPHRLAVTPVIGRDRTLHDLHVLLRHRLLREAGGFEGFRLCPADTPPHAFSAPPTAYMPDRVLKGDRASRTVAQGAQGGDHHISVIVDINDVDVVVGKGIEPALPPSADSGMAMQAPLQGNDARNGFHVVVHEGEEGVKVAPVDGFDSATGELDVLLRHRPRSITRKGAAFRPKRLLRQPGGFEGCLLVAVGIDPHEPRVPNDEHDSDVDGNLDPAGLSETAFDP